MIALLLICGLLLLVVAILLAPLRIQVDTTKGLYLADWGHILQMRLFPAELLVRFSFLGLRKEWDVLKLTGGGRKEKEVKKTREKRRRLRMSGRRFVRVLGSFRVREWSIDLDTGDYCRNALIYPAFQFMNLWKGHWHVNFEGDSKLRITVHNRLGRIAGALLLPERRKIKFNLFTQ